MKSSTKHFLSLLCLAAALLAPLSAAAEYVYFEICCRIPDEFGNRSFQWQ